jgi:DNA-binding XRE family transcriptional regulator
MHHPELAAELAEVHPGVALKQMREKGGFGIRQVARAVGCSPSTLMRIERQTIKHPDPDPRVGHRRGDRAAPRGSGDGGMSDRLAYILGRGRRRRPACRLDTLRRYIKREDNQRLPAKKPGGRYLILADELQTWLENLADS